MALNLGDVVNITIQGDLFNQRLLNSLHYIVIAGSTTDDSATDLATFATAINTNIGTLLKQKYLGCVTAQFVWTGVRAQRIWPTRSVFSFSPASTPGTELGTNVLTNTAQTITKRTLLGGRKFVGSIHLPPPPIEQVTQGNLTGGQQTVLNNLGVEMLNTITVAGAGGSLSYRPVLFHKTDPGTPTSLFQVVAQPTVRVMRRRTVGLGI